MCCIICFPLVWDLLNFCDHISSLHLHIFLEPAVYYLWSLEVFMITYILFSNQFTIYDYLHAFLQPIDSLILSLTYFSLTILLFMITCMFFPYLPTTCIHIFLLIYLLMITCKIPKIDSFILRLSLRLQTMFLRYRDDSRYIITHNLIQLYVHHLDSYTLKNIHVFL